MEITLECAWIVELTQGTIKTNKKRQITAEISINRFYKLINAYIYFIFIHRAVYLSVYLFWMLAVAGHHRYVLEDAIFE